MVSVLQTPKSRFCKNFENANILFAVLIISVLSSGLAFHYSFLLKNSAHRTRLLKFIQDKNQTLVLVHKAFHRLKSIATRDDCFTYEKDDQFFIGNAPIECKLTPNAGYCIHGLFQEKLPFFCFFDKQGLRKPLTEIMEYDHFFEHLTDDHWNLAKKRWEALSGTNPLQPFIFPPLIKKIEITNNNQASQMVVHFFNPYDRLLQEGNVGIENITNCIHIGSIQINALANNEESECRQTFQTLGLPIQLKLKYGTQYNISNGSLLLFQNTGDLENGFNFSLIPQRTGSVPRPQTEKVPRWRKKGTQTATSPVVQNIDKHSKPLVNLFPTQTWVDKVNACFFKYESAEPYNKINNFQTAYDDVPTLRNQFWNDIVVDPKSNVFYFNGPKNHIEEKLHTYGIDPDRMNETVETIIKNQPYKTAAAFLTLCTSFPEIKNNLHLFENLSHRVEKFKIEAWHGKCKCEITVQRSAENETQRTWHMICTRWTNTE